MCARTINWESYFRFVMAINDELAEESTTTTDEEDDEIDVRKLTRGVVARMKRLESIYLRQKKTGLGKKGGEIGPRLGRLHKVPTVRLRRLTEDEIREYKIGSTLRSSDKDKSKSRGIKVHVTVSRSEKFEGFVMEDRRRSTRRNISYEESKPQPELGQSSDDEQEDN